MGWGYGINDQGREVGYGVEATCDHEGCDEKIDRGLAYVCGGMHDGDEHGCGRYFCGEHLGYYWRGPDEDMSVQLCGACGPRWQLVCNECGLDSDGEAAGTACDVLRGTGCPGVITPETEIDWRAKA